MKTYQCPECNHRMEITLTAEEWDSPPPSCAMCDARTNQEFHPPAIGGSVRMQAAKIAENIIREDYGIANVTFDRKGGQNKVSYKDQTAPLASSWGTVSNALETAISIGRKTRLESGNGLDILQRNLQSGAQPDLIEASKRRAIKVW